MMLACLQSHVYWNAKAGIFFTTRPNVTRTNIILPALEDAVYPLLPWPMKSYSRVVAYRVAEKIQLQTKHGLYGC